MTQFSIRPFNDHDLISDPIESSRRKKWNQKLSSLRISVEHAFGRLKTRFPYLRSVSGTDINFTYKIVEAIIIIYNFLETQNNEPRENETLDELELVNDHNDQELRENDGLEGDSLFRAGLLRRKYLMNYLETL